MLLPGAALGTACWHTRLDSSRRLLVRQEGCYQVPLSGERGGGNSQARQAWNCQGAKLRIISILDGKAGLTLL